MKLRANPHITRAFPELEYPSSASKMIRTVRQLSRRSISRQNIALRYNSGVRDSGRLNLRWQESAHDFKDAGYTPNQPYNPDNLYDLPDFPVPQDQEQIRLKELMSSRFYNSHSYLTNNLPKTEADIDYSFPPFENLRHVADNNCNTPPDTGSIIEFVNPETQSLGFGVVLSKSRAKFNANYNKLIVLSMQNELVSVSPLFVNCHLHQVINGDWINSLEILENKFNESYSKRSDLVSVLNGFLNESMSYNEILQPQFATFYSQYSQSHTIRNVSLVQVIESIKFPSQILTQITRSYFHQSALFMALHLQFSKSSRFVSTSQSSSHRLTNVSQGFSNELVHNTNYYINSVENSNAVDIYLSVCNGEKFTELNSFLNTLTQEQQQNKRSREDLFYYFLFWEARKFSYIVTVMKLALVYPHDEIISVLRKLDIFETASPTEIYNWLIKIKLFDPKTDIFLSSNISGKPKLKKLALSCTEEIEPVVNHEHLDKLIDLFPHLRNGKSFYKDHVIYGLPGTSLGISLEKINSRKYLFNIHIPDVMTKISPSSDLFKVLLSKRYNLISLQSMNQLFSRSFVKGLSFENQNLMETPEFVSVGDISTVASKPSSSDLTCMTLSVIYNTFDANPFKDLNDKISISFDSLSSVTIKKLNAETLESSLKEKSTLSSFKIFKRDTKNDDSQGFIDNDDRHNLGFMFNILRTSLKLRNQNGAAVIDEPKFDPKGSSDIVLGVRSSFFISEVDVFLGDLLRKYCSQWNIPVFTNNQEVLEEEDIQHSQSSSDDVLVSHNNKMLPKYSAHTFGDTLLAKDQAGHISLPAKVIGANFLGKPTLELIQQEQKNVAMGIHGFVKMSNIFSSVEPLLNQLQLLNHAQLQYNNDYLRSVDRDQIQLLRRFGYLKRYGYNMNGPLHKGVLNEQVSKIKNNHKLSETLAISHNRFWSLKELEEKLMKETGADSTQYKCFVTHHGYKFEEKMLVYAYCADLGIEVNILTPQVVSIGTVVNCDRVVHLDAVTGICVLGQEELF